jgi:hypothetical protein
MRKYYSSFFRARDLVERAIADGSLGARDTRRRLCRDGLRYREGRQEELGFGAPGRPPRGAPRLVRDPGVRAPRGRCDIGPTPSGATMRDSSLAGSLRSWTYIAKLEVNRSYDYNDRYTRDSSGVDGQPSLIYECELEIGAVPSKAVFKPIGTGSLDGSAGRIRAELEGLTTALQLLECAELSYGGPFLE